MNYIISDIHGCYDEYLSLIEKLALTNDDKVNILGDSIDRGPEPIKVLKDIMYRPNFTYILGNHDFMMLEVISLLMKEITNENIESLEADEVLYSAFDDWMKNGGEITLQQFLALERWEQEDILLYLQESSTYKTIEHDNKLFILVHADIQNFSVDKELEEYSAGDFIFGRANYEKQYFPGNRIFLVTGHTPTPYINKDKSPTIYTKHNHIAIDCACVFGGKLAAYCIETGNATYVDAVKKTTY